MLLGGMHDFSDIRENLFIQLAAHAPEFFGASQ